MRFILIRRADKYTDGSGEPTVKELIAGFTITQVNSKEEVMEWAKRWPALNGEADTGIRQIFEAEGFGPAESWIS